MKLLGWFIEAIISVIIEILGALVINNWNEYVREKKYPNQISSSIENGLIESKLDRSIVIPKKMALIYSLDKHLHDKEVAIHQIVGNADGIQHQT